MPWRTSDEDQGWSPEETVGGGTPKRKGARAMRGCERAATRRPLEPPTHVRVSGSREAGGPWTLALVLAPPPVPLEEGSRSSGSGPLRDALRLLRSSQPGLFETH